MTINTGGFAPTSEELEEMQDHADADEVADAPYDIYFGDYSYDPDYR